jgi:HAD superfamily hydrolase (TIGR01549 family)
MPKGPSLSHIQAVLFDVDGTLVDSVAPLVIGLQETFARYGSSQPDAEEVRSLIGMPLRRQIEMFCDVRDEEHLKEIASFTITRFEANSHLESTYKPAIETLTLMHGCGLKTALVTSKNRAEIELFRGRFPAWNSVDGVVCSSDVRHPKPHPESALLACSQLGVEPDRALMIGDSIYDFQCASGAGVAFVGVGYGAAGRQPLVDIGAEPVFDTPEQLLEWANQELAELPCLERK